MENLFNVVISFQNKLGLSCAKLSTHTSVDLANQLLGMVNQPAVNGDGSLAKVQFTTTGGVGLGGGVDEMQNKADLSQVGHGRWLGLS